MHYNSYFLHGVFLLLKACTIVISDRVPRMCSVYKYIVEMSFYVLQSLASPRLCPHAFRKTLRSVAACVRSP